jgi:hypothetical protein
MIEPTRVYGDDGKPIATPEEMQSFLACCEDPMGRLWQAMVYKAAIRSYKGDWTDRMTITAAVRRLKEELAELEEELEHPHPDYEKVLYEIADVCNFGVVIEDLLYAATHRPLPE